tara:strand:- start:9763 stop:9960 length:198 start_codon:yes stop_codon:yes gene_type:complete
MVNMPSGASIELVPLDAGPIVDIGIFPVSSVGWAYPFSVRLKELLTTRRHEKTSLEENSSAAFGN